MDPVLTAYIFKKLGDLGVAATAKIYHEYYKKVKAYEVEEGKEIRATRIEKAARIVRDGLLNQVLEGFYPLDKLADRKFYMPEVLVSDKTNRLHVAVREDLHNLNVSIAPGRERHKVVSAECAFALNESLIADILADITYWKLKVWDQPIYCLKSVDIIDNDLACEFYINNFMRYRYSYGGLWNEAIQGLIDANLDVGRIVGEHKKYFPLRSHYLPDAASLCDLNKRLCAGGIHATVAIAREKDYVIPLQMRSSSVSDGQHSLAVTPSGYHQPLSAVEAELSLSLTFQREFFEELLGGEEAQRRTNRLQHDWFIRDSDPIKWLDNNCDKWKLTCSGVLLNMAQGNYDIPLVCIIEDVDFWKLHGHKLVSCPVDTLHYHRSRPRFSILVSFF